jgi:hypothetical protein
MKTVVKQGVLVKRLKKIQQKNRRFFEIKSSPFRKIGAENEEFRDLVKAGVEKRNWVKKLTQGFTKISKS